jgi:tetratricopeptide (TPR) repeat protein
VADPLRELWDFDDLESTEGRLEERLEAETHAESRAEILTQLARVCGLRGEFDEGERLLDEAQVLAGAHGSGSAQLRIDLERGRLRRSSGDPEAALPLFESAFHAAVEAAELALAADAAHMAALAAPSREAMLSWTQAGIDVAESSADGSVRYWLGPLLNNLGWEHYESGEYEPALAAFRRALDERERDPANRAAVEIARYAVAKALRALGRPAEAAPLLEEAAAWAEGEGKPDGWFHEELAESYADLGRAAKAAEQARKAQALLSEADPSFEEDGDRASRLRRLAEATTDSSR